MKSRLGVRNWITLILIGLFGQFAWTIENMYFNVFLYNTISTDPGYIAAMVGWSAAAATMTTLLMGALSDRVGKRKAFICAGYILWDSRPPLSATLHLRTRGGFSPRRTRLRLRR